MIQFTIQPYLPELWRDKKPVLKNGDEAVPNHGWGCANCHHTNNLECYQVKIDTVPPEGSEWKWENTAHYYVCSEICANMLMLAKME